MEERKIINLLSNEPCREDAFEGHAHQHVAEQIARIIREDKHRHIIGIEGGWGSGKSNLISLINIGLNGECVYNGGFDHKESYYPFFVYDAWGHQVDYQRRAILEELTQDLTNEKKILEKKKWQRKLDNLLAKKRKTTTKEVPKMGIGLVIGILLCMATPLVKFLVELIPEENWKWRLIVAVVPYVVGIIYAITNRYNSLKRNNQKTTITNILSELILIYKDQIKENETYTTISEKEPSSSEFKAWMEDVNTDLANADKILIIVFDNMDRLPSQKVESLWSSIHSFFSDKTYDHIKVLIPFDRQHVNQAFKSEDDKERVYGNDFINKTFDVVFRVSPPIMSGWQQYMEDMWKKAFGDDEELHISVTQIYGALRKVHTPRKIIAFINEVATVKMTMQDKIPDEYIALFVFGKEQMEQDPIGQLLNPTFMGDVKFEYENNPETIKYLSALYYQLPVDKALDVVFTKEAAESLNSGDSERLHEMMDRIDMPTILGNAILKVTNVEKATIALAGMDRFLDYGDYGNMPNWLKKIWEDLYQHCHKFNIKWNEIKDFHIQLYNHLHDEQLAEDLVSGYLSIEDEKWDTRRYKKSIDQLREDGGRIDKMLAKYRRKVNPKLFLELLYHTQDRYEEYGVSFDNSEVDNYLAELNMEEAITLQVIPYIKEKDIKGFKQYKSKLRGWIANSNNNDMSIIKGLFARLKEVEEHSFEFNNIYNDTRIFNGWNSLKDANDIFKYDLLAMRVARINNFPSPNRSAFSNILQSVDEEDVTGLTNVIQCYIDYGDLLEHSADFKDFPLIVKVVEMLTVKSVGISRANIMQCFIHFDLAINDYGLDPEKLYNRLDGWGEYIKFNSTNIINLPNGVFEQAEKTGNMTSQKLHHACDEYFHGLSQEQWKDHCLNKDDTYRIWKLYHPKKYQANFDALKSILKDYANNTIQQPDEMLIYEWVMLCVKTGCSVKELFNEVSSILKRDSNINKEKLLYFGHYILEHTSSEKQKDFIEKLIPTEIIDKDVVDFVAKHIDKLKDCNIPDEFKEKIRHLSETSMKGEGNVRVVCDAMGIMIEKNPEDV